MLEKDAYVEGFDQEWRALVDAARQGVMAPLPSCPGWSVGRLLGHLGSIYTSVNKNIRVGHGEDVVIELEDLELRPEIEQWFRAGWTDATTPTNVVDWFEEAASNLEHCFRTSAPDERTWTWWEPDQTVGFWMRRMTHETAVHRWDAQLAHGEPRPIDSDRAADGVDEALTVYQPKWCRPESKVAGRGESYHFHRTDGPGEWVVRFEGKGMDARREHGKADVALRGSGSDLLLFLWHRIPAGQLEVVGDRALVDRYFELAPPD